MSDMEKARARREAVESTARASSSAHRERWWAGLNSYLMAETEHALRAAATDEREGREKPPDDRPDTA